MELIRSVATEQEGNSMFAGVGEWTREGTQLYREMLESGVMKDTVMVYGQMNKPSRVRLRVALSALSMAEYFRDQARDVLLFIDNIFRFSISGSDVSALLGRMLSAAGYQPTLATKIGELQERITSCGSGTLHTAREVKRIIQHYKDLQDIMVIFGIDELSEDDKLIVARARKIERFFSQLFFVAERFSGVEGRYVPLRDTVRGLREILDGKCDDLPEQVFMMAGTIEDVREKADRLAKGA